MEQNFRDTFQRGHSIKFLPSLPSHGTPYRRVSAPMDIIPGTQQGTYVWATFGSSLLLLRVLGEFISLSLSISSVQWGDFPLENGPMAPTSELSYPPRVSAA